MAFKVFVVLLIASLAFIAVQGQRCGRYEVYDECGFCEQNCNKDIPPICAAICSSGCYCQPGMYRKGHECVPEYFCSKQEVKPLAIPCGEFDPDCF